MARRSPTLRVASDLAAFALEHKKWWIVPILVVSLLVLVLLVVAQTPVAPFVYTLF
ncbi:MAG: hypothetical protein HYV09_15170 [Deltaproteobacteria bacterium]|nr:hypothetical protein [Deltaproteobacteria bacterium]